MKNSGLRQQFIKLLGNEKVAFDSDQTSFYKTGWRSGGGDAFAVLFPHSLLEFWHCLSLCVETQCIIIMQAANTGLTEGSTPKGTDYDRPVVIINTLAINSIFVIGNGEQVISLAGATLNKLESALKPLNRLPHSVIGSSCLGASIVGGIANNSGGALVKRGPAYTEFALFAQVDEKGKLHLVNHLGMYLGDNPEEILTNLESQNFDTSKLSKTGKASSRDYEKKLRDINANSPSRYNADPSCLFEASGCAGKLAVFAVRLDTFKAPNTEQTFYIGTNNSEVLSQLRTEMLSKFKHLPEVAEYIHQQTFKVAQKYGKDGYLSIKHLGTARLPTLFKTKSKIDNFFKNFKLLPQQISDRTLQFIANALPNHLPNRITKFGQTYEHHLLLKMSDEGIVEARQYLELLAKEHGDDIGFFECNEQETEAAFLQRFVAANAASRYQIVNDKKVGDVLALDIALNRNEQNWLEELPPRISKHIDKALYYGHFFCHVFHQDYILKKDTNTEQIKQELLMFLDKRGAKYPAEHNVGHLYEAEQHVKDFYTQLDPTNTFNPGIGKTSKYRRQCGC